MASLIIRCNGRRQLNHNSVFRRVLFLCCCCCPPVRIEAVFLQQHYVYNASLWWNDHFLTDTRLGPDLAQLADTFTLLVHTVISTIGFACNVQRNYVDLATQAESQEAFSQPACEQLGHCHSHLLQHIYGSHQNRIHDSIATSVRNLACDDFSPAALPYVTPQQWRANDKDLICFVVKGFQAAMSNLQGVPHCDEFISAVREPQLEPCPHLGIVTKCSKGLSDYARMALSWMHIAQIRLVTQDGLDENLHVGTSMPTSIAGFRADLGLERDEILTSLLRILLDEQQESSPDAPQEIHAAEVGVNDGRTSEVLLTEVSELTLMLVDPFEFRSKKYDQFYYFTRINTTCDGLIDRMQPFRKRSIIVCDSSRRAVRWVADGSLDLVFIDGDHSYDAVREDLEIWIPKLRAGGLLVGHDYCLWFVGVIRAVNELVARTGVTLNLGQDHLYWFRKP